MADRFKNRSLMAALSQLVNVFVIALQVGLAAQSLLFCRGGQSAAYFIGASNGVTPFFLFLSMVSSHSLGTIKKNTVNAIVFITMAVSYLAGPQILVHPPYYTSAKAATLALWAFVFVLMLGIWYFNKWENQKRDQAEAAGLVQEVENIEFLDLTDKQNKKFRYVL